MRRKQMSWSWGIAIALLVLDLVIGLGPIHGPTSAQEPKRFVYKVIDMPGDTRAMQTALTANGSGGWELVAVAMGELQVPRLIFKK